MIGELPESLEVNGKQYDIYPDYRNCLRILCALTDPDLDDVEKPLLCLALLYVKADTMPASDYEAALKAASAFLDHGGQEDDGKFHPRLMDWEQDENIIFPAVNRVAGFEVREVEYLHWWTFLGYCMSTDSESTFAQVIALRQKKAKHKKLEKWEREFWAANKSLCELRSKLSAEEKAEKDRLNALLG